MNPMLIGAGPAFIPPTANPFVAGMQVGGQMSGAGSTGRMFSPASNGFQLGDGFRSPAQRAMHVAAGEAHAGMLQQLRQCMTPQTNENTPTGGLRLIDSAQAKALDAVFRHADDPAQAEQVYAAGRYAARIGVEDLAVALSELRIHGNAHGNGNGNAQASVLEECDRMEKVLCKMIVNDGLGDHSGFSAWHDGNCYDEVKKLTVDINARFDALPGKPDIFQGAMQREVMPAIRQYIETNYGNQSYETWQKIDAAGGLISHAAAEAADRMTETLRAAEQEGGAGGLRAKVNQWRVAQHWAEMMRSTVAVPEQAQPLAHASTPEQAAAATPSATATAARTVAAPAPYSVTQTANPVFKPIIVIGGREVSGTLARILERDEMTAAAHSDDGGENDGVPTPQAAARQTVAVEVPELRQPRADEHGENAQTSRLEIVNDNVSHQAQGNPDNPEVGHGTDQMPTIFPADLSHVDQTLTELDGGLPHGNGVPPLRSPAQALRVNIPSPPPPPSPPPGLMDRSPFFSPLPTTATTSASPVPSTASTTSVDVHQADEDAVTLRNRPLSPVRQLIKKFDDAGIGAQSPIGNAVHIGTFLHNVGNRISTTEWPKLEEKSMMARSLMSSGDDQIVSSRSRPSSPLQTGYYRLTSETERRPYQPASAARGVIQAGQDLEPSDTGSR